MDNDPPEGMRFEMYGDGRGGMSARDVTNLVTLFNSMLREVKNDILSALKENSAAAQQRWELHEKEHETECRRFEELERRLEEHIVLANKHWETEHDEEIRFDARVQPVRASIAWAVRNWKNIALLTFAILGLLGISSDVVGRLVGM